MIKMSYLNKRMTSFGVATALALTMSSCSVSGDKKIDSSNEFNVEIMLGNNFNNEINNYGKNEFKAEKEVVTPPIVVPIENVTMGNGEIGYKIPQFYYPYIVDENLPIPSMTSILEENDEYQILGGCDRINSDGTITHCGFEGAVAVYKPYWFLLNLDKEQRDEKELQLIAEVENLVEQVYYDKAKTNTKK